MARPAAFTGSVVAADRAQRVVAPPYDSLLPAQREAMAAADPDSFLGALPSGSADDDLEARLVACRTALDRMLARGVFAPLPAPALVVVTLGVDDRHAVAVVGDLEVAAFTDGRVLGHERTRPERVTQLARYLDVVGVVSSPVAVAHRPAPAVTRLTDDVRRRTPDVAFVAEDGVEVTVRAVTDPATIDALAAAVDAAGQLYVADGHHRAAAAAAHAAHTGAAPGSPAARVLTAIVPSDHLEVAPFHRRIDEVELAPGELVVRLRTLGLDPVPVAGPVAPREPGTFTVTDGAGWWRLDLRDRRRPGAVESLDVRLAEREVLEPLLDGEGSGHPRMVAVAPAFDLEVLALPGGVGVALAPPPFDAVLAVADAGDAMPAKTTYVTPKLRSGLLLAPR